MPSPFPGMDPYLEHPSVFPGLHNRLIALLGEALQAALPPPYFAEIGERVWVEVSGRFIEPDASILQSPSQERGGVAALPTRSVPVVVTVPHDERREPFLEIRTTGDSGEQLITAVEILSPSNKTAGERGRDLYLRKQQEVLASRVHLVEIDLLHGGLHTTAVDAKRLHQAVGRCDYHVSVHRSDRFEDFFIYPIQLRDSLPEVAFPLLAGDPDVPIDLQAIFDRAYDVGPYRRRIRYRDASPVPPLAPELHAWAEALLPEEP
ncbi:DUF4058 family protein [Paludisphaera rhizosphaerae]|uniref:DUF4058 family protein n=1 Tax=Paludisphaera rhizosphaerae TaxID=2711216 RepID=UPI0013ECDDC1|nr:DUF4058 family protein [Paludisphaera rhizosphaerae]